MPAAPTPIAGAVPGIKSVLKRILAGRAVESYWFFWARVPLRVRKPLVIAVTGSVGKTTTVAMIATVLGHPSTNGQLGRVVHTENNMNDDIGLPLTVLRFGNWLTTRQRLVATLLLPFRALFLAFSPDYPKVLVLEYGTHWKGHLHRLVKLAPPDIAVVTTIGPAHLERLKNVQGVIHEKGAVVRAVPASGLVILGSEHEHVAELEALARGRVLEVPGRGPCLSQEIARVIALHLGLSEQVIETAVADFKPQKGRLNQLRLDRMTIIDDSYNANPLSMQLGLDTLSEIAAPGQRRLAFLGTMAELGENAASFHEQIGAYARQKSDVVVGVGELARHYDPDHWFGTSRACAEHLQELIRADDCVLVKGSKSAEMGVIVERARSLCQRVPGSSSDLPADAARSAAGRSAACPTADERNHAKRSDASAQPVGAAPR